MRYYDREEWPGFLSAIRAAPTDDLPRLVCADWLEENGEPERAAFVRIQCEIAKLEAEEVQHLLHDSIHDHEANWKAIDRQERTDTLRDRELELLVKVACSMEAECG